MVSVGNTFSDKLYSEIKIRWLAKPRGSGVRLLMALSAWFITAAVVVELVPAMLESYDEYVTMSGFTTGTTALMTRTMPYRTYSMTRFTSTAWKTPMPSGSPTSRRALATAFCRAVSHVIMAFTMVGDMFFEVS